MNIIEVKDLKKAYLLPSDKTKTFNAVDSISLGIKKGEVYGILGPNGAGKTTTLEMLEGLKEIDDGSAIIDGIDVSKDPYEVKKVIGVQLQSNEYFDKLDLSELLTLFSKLYSTNIDHSKLLDQVNLLDKANAKTQHLSGGQRQLLALGRALISKPNVILLDEPSAGLSPKAIDEVFEYINLINQNGVSILLVEQNAKRALKFCDRGYVLDQGRNAYTGSGEDLLNDDKVVELYLGKL